MQIGDSQVGAPAVLYTGTQAAIEALSGVIEGAFAYATDIDKVGYYNGSAWSWVDPSGGNDPNAIHDNVSGEIHAVALKDVPGTWDEVLIEDEADSWSKKRITLNDIPIFGLPVLQGYGSGISTYRYGMYAFDNGVDGPGWYMDHLHDIDPTAMHTDSAGEINGLTEITPADEDVVLVEDASNSWAKKKVTMLSVQNAMSVQDIPWVHDDGLVGPLFLMYDDDNTVYCEVDLATAALYIGDGLTGLDENATAASDDLIFINDGVSGKTVQAGNVFKSLGREKLTAARTYYVRTDGSDSNNGLANTSGGAFLTIQKAVDVVGLLDTGGQTVTIQIADGTYNENVALKNVVGHMTNGDLIIKGNAATPANVVVNGSNTNDGVFNSEGVDSIWRIQDLKVTGTNCHGIYAAYGGYIEVTNVNFGAFTGSYIAHMSVRGGTIDCIGNYTISGSCYRHINTAASGLIQCQGRTVTFTASTTWTQFAFCSMNGTMIVNGNTYSLGAYTATGKRYESTLNGVLWTNGGGSTYFPGDTSGTTATGGQYA